MSRLSPSVVNQFFEACQWTYDVWCTHRTLFDDNPQKRKLRASVAGEGLYRLSVISQEYLLQQIAKLHDPARQNGQDNLGIDYVFRHGHWDKDVSAKLGALKRRLDRFAHKIRPARHKILSHNDLKTALSGLTLGAFPEGEDVKYFKDLQEFVDVVHDALLGGPSPFSDDARRDATALISCLEI